MIAFEDVTKKIIGATIQVHRILGPHFQELTYQRALIFEFQMSGLGFGREVSIPVFYRGRKLIPGELIFWLRNAWLRSKQKMVWSPEILNKHFPI